MEEIGKKIISDSLHVIAPPPLIFIFGFVAGMFIEWFVPLHFFRNSVFYDVGLFIAIMSGLLALWGIWVMYMAGTNINPARPVIYLVTVGPFRFSRNPLYLSLTLLSIGLSMILDFAWIIIILILVLYIMNRFVIEREENYLESKIGEQYIEYKKKVRRWI
jgi:protein-S-isoprenylcysteine O-methyltransferase Ste14